MKTLNASIAARKKWGKKLKQEEVGLPLSNISLEATASQMEGNHAHDTSHISFLTKRSWSTA